MDKHKCDACGFAFDAENPQLRALHCPACTDGIARPQSEHTIREVWARIGTNHHRIFYAEGPASLLLGPHDKMVQAALTKTKGTEHAQAKGGSVAFAEYDGLAMIVNGEIVKEFGAFALPEATPEEIEQQTASRGDVVVVEKGKPTAKRTRAVKRG